ncbi:DUF1573 domain-containing protein [Mucilaginibacter aquatilis]|uniref:DUF1573 domain-containing protein n=1 Tax=Mucilaginibacter aquatilis TaxID=1517760 RepID=A0A6I4IBF9_9SPHI|nr:DUF1573 domain-containing protein [Mucilaginibacter aquatilis]MVN92531.1 DUF1573 domain-containing protein [Mucilaginibacter aquatilis]
MKRNIFRFLTLIVVVLCGCSNKPEEPVINFKSSVIDLGRIDFNAKPVTATFGFTNGGQKELKLISVAADCTCTIPSYTAKPIAYHEQGVIKVVFDPKAANTIGAMERSVVVRTNTKPQLHTLIVKMVVCK